MKDKKMRAVIVILCLVIGFAIGYFGEEVIEEDDDDGASGSDVFYEPVIDADNFVDEVDHPYYPLAVGNKWTYEGETEDGTELIEVYVTEDTKEIMGITCTVVRDTVSVEGEVVEDTWDWFAQDKDGNVWYMGEHSEEYEDGEYIGTEGSWEAGVDGAKPGIVMPAHPLVGFSYYQEYYKGEAEDMGAVLSLDGSETVEYGSFDNLIVTRDWNPLEPGVVESKYYAEGIGVILETVLEGPNERVELVDFETDRSDILSNDHSVLK